MENCSENSGCVSGNGCADTDAAGKYAEKFIHWCAGGCHGRSVPGELLPRTELCAGQPADGVKTLYIKNCDTGCGIPAGIYSETACRVFMFPQSSGRPGRPSFLCGRGDGTPAFCAGRENADGVFADLRKSAVRRAASAAVSEFCGPGKTDPDPAAASSAAALMYVYGCGTPLIRAFRGEEDRLFAPQFLGIYAGTHGASDAVCDFAAMYGTEKVRDLGVLSYGALRVLPFFGRRGEKDPEEREKTASRAGTPEFPCTYTRLAAHRRLFRASDAVFRGNITVLAAGYGKQPPHVPVYADAASDAVRAALVSPELCPPGWLMFSAGSGAAMLKQGHGIRTAGGRVYVPADAVTFF